MKTFLALFAAVLLAGGVLLAVQHAQHSSQKEHDRKIAALLGLAESTLKAHNSTVRLLQVKDDADVRSRIAASEQRLHDMVPKLESAAADKRTAPADMEKLRHLASEFR